jgi:hypothetical protein
MRYSWQIFLWEIILIMAAGIIYPERIFAQTPIASPTATLPANTVTVNDGTITRVDFPPETKKPDDKNIIEFLFGAQTGDTLKIPDLITNGLLPRYEQASTNLTQSQVLDSYIDPQTDLRVSGVATFCTDKNGAITKRSSRYISGKDKDNQFSRLNNASGKFAALWIRKAKAMSRKLHLSQIRLRHVNPEKPVNRLNRYRFHFPKEESEDFLRHFGNFLKISSLLKPQQKQ